MDPGALRAVVRSFNFAIHGVPAVVTVPGGDPVDTRVIWLTPNTAPVGVGGSARADTRRALAIRLDEVPEVPRGTVVEAVEPTRTEPALWKVDGIEKVAPDHVRALVLPVAEEDL